MMRPKKLLIAAAIAASLAVAGLAYDSLSGVAGAGYVCPLTGEHLPCQNCCPLGRR